MLTIESISLQSSYYLDRSYVVYSPGQVSTVERIRSSSQTFSFGYGPDTGGGNTLRMLQYLHGRFGPVASFSGSYRANSWTLQISRQNSSGMFATDCDNCSLIAFCFVCTGCTSPTITSGTVTMAATHQSTTVTTLTSETFSGTSVSSVDTPCISALYGNLLKIRPRAMN